jgi:transcription elongation factor GreA
LVEDDILTWDGLRQLKAELDYLKGEKRRQMAAKMKEALAFGDPWDNAEYATVKAEQMLIEGRIMVLENLLRNVQVLPPGCNPSDRVEVGSWVRVLDMETQEEHCYRIVGSREADPSHMRISHRSPVARSLLGKKIGDVATVLAPGGRFSMRILSIGDAAEKV